VGHHSCHSGLTTSVCLPCMVGIS